MTEGLMQQEGEPKREATTEGLAAADNQKAGKVKRIDWEVRRSK